MSRFGKVIVCLSLIWAIRLWEARKTWSVRETIYYKGKKGEGLPVEKGRFLSRPTFSLSARNTYIFICASHFLTAKQPKRLEQPGFG